MESFTALASPSGPANPQETKMLTRSNAVLASAALMLTLAACSGESTPDVTPAAETVTETVTAEPTETGTPTTEPTEAATTEEPAASAGTREAPLALGETRKVADESTWTVGITASNLDAAAAIRAADEFAEEPGEGERFVLATLSVTVDAAALEAQGIDISEGADPRASLFVSYVAADGTSYDSTAAFCSSANAFITNAGTLYSDGASTSGDVCVVVPADKADGGLWRVSNLNNDAVWIASA